LASSKEVSIENVKEWPEEHVRTLKKSWITTVEQVIATSATPGGLSLLAQQLAVSEEEMRRLVDVARTYLDPAVAAEMEQPVDVSQYGLGALKPKSR